MRGRYDAACEARWLAVHAMVDGLDDHEIASIWDSLPEDARDFGRLQGDETAHGLVDILAWGLAYLCETSPSNPYRAK